MQGRQWTGKDGERQVKGYRLWPKVDKVPASDAMLLMTLCYTEIC